MSEVGTDQVRSIVILDQSSDSIKCGVGRVKVVWWTTMCRSYLCEVINLSA